MNFEYECDFEINSFMQLPLFLFIDNKTFLNVGDCKLDTGAFRTVLSAYVLPYEIRNLLKNPIKGISATNNELVMYELDIKTIIIGQVPLFNFNLCFTFNWKDASRSLIGMDILSCFNYMVNNDNHSLFFWAPKERKAPGAARTCRGIPTTGP